MGLRRIGRSARRFLLDRRANAGAEFALILPLLMLILFGGIEVGRALHDFHKVNATVRDAGRYLSRVTYQCPTDTAGTGLCQTCDSSTGDCGICAFVDGNNNPTAVPVTNAQVLARTGTTVGGSPLLAGWTDNDSVTVELCTVDNSDDPKPFQGMFAQFDLVPHVKVTAEAPFTFLFGNLISSEATIDITLSHNVIMSSQPCRPQDASLPATLECPQTIASEE